MLRLEPDVESTPKHENSNRLYSVSQISSSDSYLHKSTGKLTQKIQRAKAPRKEYSVPAGYHKREIESIIEKPICEAVINKISKLGNFLD